MQSTGQKAEPEWTDLGKGSAWNVGNVPSQIPQEQELTVSSSSPSGFWAFCLPCSDNLRPFGLITLSFLITPSFFHLPVPGPVLWASPSSTSGTFQAGITAGTVKVPGHQVWSQLCSHWALIPARPRSALTALVGRFRALPQTVSSCCLTALQQTGQTEVTRLAFTRMW